MWRYDRDSGWGPGTLGNNGEWLEKSDYDAYIR